MGTYSVQNQNFSGGTEEFANLRKAILAAKKLCQATIYRGEVRMAQVCQVQVWTGNSSDSVGGQRGYTMAYMVQLTPEGEDTLQDDERRFFPRRA